MNEPIEYLLEESIQRLKQGQDLEAILAENPESASRLRPLLEAAQMALLLNAPVQSGTLQAAQVRSRSAFVAKARKIRPEKPNFWLQMPLRSAGYAILVVAMLFSTLFGVGAVSAQTVPGDVLYPVKREVENVRLQLAPDLARRLDLEVEFDSRRSQEVRLLISKQNRQPVTFSGLLEKTADGWQISLIPVQLAKGLDQSALDLQGQMIEASGYSLEGDGVFIERIELHSYHIAGKIKSISSTRLRVDGIELTISPQTIGMGEIEVGDWVEMTVVKLPSGEFAAQTIRSQSDDSPAPAILLTETVAPFLEETSEPAEIEAEAGETLEGTSEGEDAEMDSVDTQSSDDDAQPADDSEGEADPPEETNTPEPDESDSDIDSSDND